ncbi:dihydrodipicolinate reductase [Candidatus Parcubacteria bacterium]|nr:dihydrodipicolinate reductase [Candidatus Parcubacteria bacterium]
MGKNKIMLAGPGNMGTMIGRRILTENGLELSKTALAEDNGGKMRLGPEANFLTIKLAGMDFQRRAIIDENPDVIIDFTHPDSVNRNAELYCELGIPFIMGTTGGERGHLKETVEESDICAVIAPNMAPQIVAFQAMMEYAANTFPNAFKGYGLVTRESHQEPKKDTSGTAKAMAGYYNKLGISFEIEDIIKVRDPVVQRIELGVPEEHLDGHGWHSYYLLSADGNVRFEFKHNVNGREIYVDGVMLAISFLLSKIEKNCKGKVFSMIDVLKVGQSQ